MKQFKDDLELFESAESRYKLMQKFLQVLRDHERK